MLKHTEAEKIMQPFLTTLSKKVMFHLLSNRIFRKRFVNGKQPLQISALVPTQAEGSAVNGRCTSCVSVLLLLSKNYLSHTDLMEL